MSSAYLYLEFNYTAQGLAQTLGSGGRSWHQNVNFYTTVMFYTQNTQFSMFYQTVVVGGVRPLSAIHRRQNIGMLKGNRTHHVRPIRKRRAGKQNFTQVSPCANWCSLPQLSQFFEISTLFCPNGLKWCPPELPYRAGDIVYLHFFFN